MTESEFNRKFRKQMTERGVKIIRIESHTTCPGCPDNHYVGKGFCGWIEMKQEKSMPKRIVYRPQQPVWLHDYWMWGGTAWTFLFVEDENMVVVIPASQTLVASRNLSAAEREEVPLGPAGWIRLARILRTGECVLAV